MGAKRRHAEISGAGIAGLTTACVLAQRGWSVRVHERSEELREMGAGLYLKVNSLLVLKEIGLLDELKSSGMVLRQGQIISRKGRILHHRAPAQRDETITVLRGTLHRALARRATELGVQFETNSVVNRADPTGKLTIEGGKTFDADVVIGADGYRSPVRDSLKLLKEFTFLKEGAIRALAPRIPGEREGRTTEQWSGDCRVGIVPSSSDQLYLYLIGPADNSRAKKVPVDKAFWQERFPQIADIIERIPEDGGRYDQLCYATVHGWSAGRVAIIGDAVHAQPPNLGQGAGMAIANASALGAALDEHEDVATALKRWELARRPLTEEVQRWSYRYGFIFYALPFDGALAEIIRSGMISAIGRIGFTARKLAWLQRGGYHAGEGNL